MARSSSFPIVLLFVVVLAVIGGGAYFFFQDMDPPQVSLAPETERMSIGQTLTVTAADAKSGIKSIRVSVRKGPRTQVVFEEEFADKPKERKVTFTLKDLTFKEGAFELEVRAADGSKSGFGRGNTATRVYQARLDSTPPRVSIKTPQPYVRRGGTGVIVYTVSKEVEKSGVTVGDYFFPGHKQASGDYICFFAFPYFMTVQNFQPELSAVDNAGNKASVRVPVYKMHRDFRKDTLNISDSFLNDKMPYFEEMLPGSMTQVERFLKVNNELRKDNAKALLELGKKTSSSMLWNDYFIRLPAAPRAGFGDHRTYMHNGQKLDTEATHLGLDLADLAQSPVPASNSGKVVYAGILGIYGELIVIDHGLGMQSLYSHLSEIHVTVGQNVERGQIIGKTGATGMAGGDHLHYGITIAGLEVSPLEWIDGHWIRDNVVDRLTAAGVAAPQLSTPPAPPPATVAPGKKPAAKSKLTPGKPSGAKKKKR